MAVNYILCTLLSMRSTLACEPVVPFMQVMVPALALSRSMVVLVAAVMLKSVLFAVFERRLPHAGAAWSMLLGNILTSFVGLLVAVMIASGAGVWIIGVPVVCLLCWLPARRLVRQAPLAWIRRATPSGIAVGMTVSLLASCVLFMVGQGALGTHQLGRYWVIKTSAIFLALLASVSLTTIWEEWAIWRLRSRPEGVSFFMTALRANLYTLIGVLAVPAALILPARLESPNFLAHLLTVIRGG